MAGEHELGELRKDCDAAWIGIIEPEGLPPADPSERRTCRCFDAAHPNRRWSPRHFHPDEQDTGCDAWKRLLDPIEEEPVRCFQHRPIGFRRANPVVPYFKLQNFRRTAMSRVRQGGASPDEAAVAFGCNPATMKRHCENWTRSRSATR